MLQHFPQKNLHSIWYCNYNQDNVIIMHMKSKKCHAFKL